MPHAAARRASANRTPRLRVVAGRHLSAAPAVRADSNPGATPGRVWSEFQDGRNGGLYDGLFVKGVLRPGRVHLSGNATWDVTADDLRTIVRDFGRFRETNSPPRLTNEHSFNPDDACGDVLALSVGGDGWLYAWYATYDAKASGKAARLDLSVAVEEGMEDGAGASYALGLAHLALCLHGRQTNQTNATRLASKHGKGKPPMNQTKVLSRLAKLLGLAPERTAHARRRPSAMFSRPLNARVRQLATDDDAGDDDASDDGEGGEEADDTKIEASDAAALIAEFLGVAAPENVETKRELMAWLAGHHAASGGDATETDASSAPAPMAMSRLAAMLQPGKTLRPAKNPALDEVKALLLSLGAQLPATDEAAKTKFLSAVEDAAKDGRIDAGHAGDLRSLGERCQYDMGAIAYLSKLKKPSTGAATQGSPPAPGGAADAPLLPTSWAHPAMKAWIASGRPTEGYGRAVELSRKPADTTKAA